MNKLQTKFFMKTMNRILLFAFCLGALSSALCAQTKPAAGKPAAKTGDPRVVKALTQTKTEYKIEDGVFNVIFGVGEKRTQTAYIVSETDALYGFEMRGVYSFAAFSKAPFPPEVINPLLEQNMQNLSAWAVLKADDDFVIVNITYVPADADGKRLDAAIQSVIILADELEERLMKQDKL